MSAPAAAAPALSRVPASSAPLAVAIAAGAGATLLGRPVGLGLTLTMLAVFGVAFAAARPRGWRLAWWIMAGGLALVPAWRAAGWLQSLAVPAALVYAALGAGGFATFREAAAVVARGALRLVPGPLLVAGALVDRMGGRWSALLPALRGVILAVLLLVPFAALFATGDAAFGEWIADAGRALPSLDESLSQRGLIAIGVLAVTGALLWTAVARMPVRVAAPAAAVGRTEWVIALSALTALFAAFVGLQLAVMFGGRELVRGTPGLTYAGYAREGFGQLVGAAALTLAVIAAARRWTVRAGAGEERLQRALLGSLCVLTLLVLVSAHRRLGLYVDAFGETRSRVFAGWEILWLGALFVLVLAAGLTARPGWLPRGAVAVTGLALLLLVASNPDGRVAQRNVERYLQTGRVDRDTLAALSADAVPALSRAPSLVECVLVPATTGDGVAGWNLARRRARGLVPGYGACAASS